MLLKLLWIFLWVVFGFFFLIILLLSSMPLLYLLEETD